MRKTRKSPAAGMRAFFGALTAIAILVGPPAHAFKNKQHDAASNLAATNAGSIAPDIEKFRSLIVGWSFGIDYTLLGINGFFGKPAEQLAHVEDQTRDIGTVFNNNGNFAQHLLRARNEYLLQNYSSEQHLTEGSYVLLGTCLHLIEDQASPPHGANVLHQGSDHFEGPLLPQKVDVGFTGTQGLVSPDLAYITSLQATQAKITSEDLIPPSPLSPQFNQYWVLNDQLRAAGNQNKSNQRYQGQYNSASVPQGVDSTVTGAYGGDSGQDVFEHNLAPSLYLQQGTQATDFAFNFLLRMSKSFRPIASGLTMTGAGGTSVLINTVGGNKISFKVIENRGANVKVKVFVQETGQAIVADNSVLRIAAGRGVNSAANETPLGGPTTWDNLSTALFDTKADDMSLLPFEADFDLTWKGEVVGQPLADGTYTLCVVAHDLDSNSSPGVAEGRTDVCKMVKMDRKPPKITVLADDTEPLAVGGYISLLPVFIDADDGDGVGVAKVSVDAADGSFHAEEAFSDGQVLALLGGGEDGLYIATAEDKGGLKATFEYRLDTTAPEITERRPVKETVYRPTELNGQIHLVVRDKGSGLDLEGEGITAWVDGEAEDSVSVTELGEGVYDVVFTFANFEFGEHTAQVDIVDKVGNVRSDNWTFVVGLDGLFPVVTAREGQVTFPTGAISGTPGQLHWFHNRIDAGEPIDGLDFIAEDAESGLSYARLETEAGVPLVTIDFPRGRRTATIGGQVLPDAPIFPSGEGYRLSVADWYGATTSFRFGIDSVKPTVAYALRFEGNADVRAIGAAQDSGSGVDRVGMGFSSSGDERGEGVKTFNTLVSQWLNEASDITEGLHRLTITDASGLYNQDNPIYVRRTFFTPSVALNDNGVLVQGISSEDPENPTLNSQMPLVVKRIIPTFSGDLTITASDIKPLLPRPLQENDVELQVPEPVTAIFSGSVEQGVPIEINKPIGVAARLKARGEGNVHVGFHIAGAVVQGLRNMPMVVLAPGYNVVVELPGIHYELPFVPPGSDWRVGVIPDVSAGNPTVGGALFRSIPGSDTKPFDLTTTGGVAGVAKFGVSYNPGRLSQAVESKLRLLRNDNGVWQDITTGVDVVSNVVFGETASNSVFGVFIATADAPADILAPITEALVIDESRSYSPGEGLAYISTEAFVTLSSTDDTSAVSAIFYAVDASSDLLALGLTRESARFFTRYRGAFSLSEGTRSIVFGAADDEGNYEALKQQSALVDGTAPFTAIVSSGGLFTFEAVDPVSNGVASGVGDIKYLVDITPADCEVMDIEESSAAAPGTCANPQYAGPFTLSTGTHVVHFIISDNVGNGRSVLRSSTIVVSVPSAPNLIVSEFVPSTATLGAAISASLSGSGFDAATTLTLERLNASAGSWSLAPPLDGLRQNHAAVRLDDGRVMIAGGAADSVGGSFLNTVRLYDPVANVWRTAASMSAGRFEFALVKLKDGRVLAAGGFTAPNTYAASAEIYDPATDTWTPTGSITRARQVTGTLMKDGTVMVAGGSDGGIATEVETYDPATGVWTTRAPLPESRAAHVQILLRDGRLMVAGGVTSGGAALASTAIYDPATDTWSDSGAMSTTRNNFRMGLLPSGKLLAAGGGNEFGALASAETYDPATGVWSPVASMSQARYAPFMSFIDGRAMVAGGLSGAGVSSVELYDPGENIWTPLASMVDVRYLFTLTALADGRHLAVGGEQNAVPTLTAELFSAPSLSIAASGVTATGSTTLNGFLDLTGAATGYWDAVVRSGARIARLDAAFRVIPEYVVAQSTDGGATLGSTRGDETIVPVSTESVATAYAAATDEQGLDLATPFLYELTPSPVVFDPPALLSFTFDPTIVDTATVAIFRFNDPLWSSAPITGQTIEYLGPNLARISGYLASASLYGAFYEAVDKLPPLVRLDYPAGVGVESALGGVVDVVGVVADTSAVTWTLTAGSVTVASGESPVSGTLASWNSAGFAGHVSVTLSATDAYGNTASTSASVYVGSPAMSLAIGKKDGDVIVSTLEKPTGIAVRQDGKLWVAKTGDDDGLLLLTPEGLVQAVVGSLKSPQGVALDASENVYVADKGNDRVLKLSPDGASVLLAIGRVDNHGKPKGGSGAGEFKHPWDVAVDANGDIYVADTGNTRIQVFDAAGTFLRQFGAGVFLSTSELRGLALSAEGLWVSDKELSHIVLLSREGALLRTVDDADSVAGEVSRTRGLATDRLGNLYVVEPNRDRVQKFGPGGRGQLAFGTRAQATPAEREAKRFLSGPVDGAIGPDGALWVSDAGRDRVVRFDLPVVGGFGVAAFTTGGGAGGEPAPAQRLVEAEDGATVARDDGTGVSIPKDALPADLEVSVAKADENEDSQEKQAKKLEKRIKSASDEVEYGPEGTRFNKPVTLTIAYTPTPGLDEKNLKVHYWNPATKDWEALDSVVDLVAKTVSAQTTHFSVYQVQGAGTGFVTAAVVDEFGLRDQYAFPNPSRRGEALTFRVQPGLADSVELRVYDLAGRKVHSSSDFRVMLAFDDGNGKGAQHTYDHVWNVSGVGSGIYYYVIVAKRAGQGDITVRGKAGVIK